MTLLPVLLPCSMLQVGNLPTFEQNRAHFGAWVVISAPLYLGFDLRNRTLLESMWPIIGNTEAIAVNQQWSGHPGWLVKAWTPQGASDPPIKEWYVTTESLGHTADQSHCDIGWQFNPASQTVTTPAHAGGVESKPCLAYLEEHEMLGMDEDDAMLVSRKCDPTDHAQTWFYDAQTHRLSSGNRSVQVDPWYAGARVGFGIHGLPGATDTITSSGGSGGSALYFDSLATGTTLNTGTTLPNDVCLNISPTAGGGEALELWAKPQPGGAMAVLLLNSHQTNTYTTEIPLAHLNIAGPPDKLQVRDIWARKDLSLGLLSKITVGPRDSQFLLLTPSRLVEAEEDQPLPPPPLPPIPLTALLGNWIHQGDNSTVTVRLAKGREPGSNGGQNTSIVFETSCKPCCFKTGTGSVSADGRHFMAVNASSSACVRLAEGSVYEGATNVYIRWMAHSPDGKVAHWRDWIKHR